MTDKEKTLKQENRKLKKEIKELVARHQESLDCSDELLVKLYEARRVERELRERLADSDNAGTELAGVIVNLSIALAKGA